MSRRRYWQQQEILQADPWPHRCACCFRKVAKWVVLCEICKGLSETSEPEAHIAITAQVLGRV